MSTETTELPNENPAQKLLELASLAPMSWAADVEQPAETHEQAVKATEAVKGFLNNIPSNNSEETKTPAVEESPSQDMAVADTAAAEYAEDGQTLDVVINGGMAASHVALEDEIAVCWDMAEQLEGDAEEINDPELSSSIKKVVDLLKAAKTPHEIAMAKMFAKMARAELDNSGSGGDDDELSLNDKITLMNQMYEAAKKEIEAAQEYVNTVDGILETNPNLLTKEETAKYKEYKEQVAKREKENEEMHKRHEKEREDAKNLSEEELKALYDRQIKEQLEMHKRWDAEDAAIWQTFEKTNQRIQESGSEKDKQDMLDIMAATGQHKAEKVKIKEEYKNALAEAEKIIAKTEDKKLVTEEKKKKASDGAADLSSYLEQVAAKSPIAPLESNEALLPELGKVVSTSDDLLPRQKELALAKTKEAKAEDVVDVSNSDLGDLPLLPKGAFSKGSSVTIS